MNQIDEPQKVALLQMMDDNGTGCQIVVWRNGATVVAARKWMVKRRRVVVVVEKWCWWWNFRCQQLLQLFALLFHTEVWQPSVKALLHRHLNFNFFSGCREPPFVVVVLIPKPKLWKPLGDPWLIRQGLNHTSITLKKTKLERHGLA